MSVNSEIKEESTEIIPTLAPPPHLPPAPIFEFKSEAPTVNGVELAELNSMFADIRARCDRISLQLEQDRNDLIAAEVRCKQYTDKRIADIQEDTQLLDTEPAHPPAPRRRCFHLGLFRYLVPLVSATMVFFVFVNQPGYVGSIHYYT